MGLQPDEAEKIGLLAVILGWEVEHHHGSDRGVGRARSWIGDFPDAFGARDAVTPRPLAAGGQGVWVNGDRAQANPGQNAGADQRTRLPRLVLHQTDSVIRVEADGAALAYQLARLGLDRLVLPASLPALEELLALAG